MLVNITNLKSNGKFQCAYITVYANVHVCVWAVYIYALFHCVIQYWVYFPHFLYEYSYIKHIYNHIIYNKIKIELVIVIIIIVFITKKNLKHFMIKICSGWSLGTL